MQTPTTAASLLLALLDLSNYICLFLGSAGEEIQELLLMISPTMNESIDETAVLEIRSAIDCVARLHDKMAAPSSSPEMTYSDLMEMRATLVTVLDAARSLVETNHTLDAVADMCDAMTLDEFLMDSCCVDE